MPEAHIYEGADGNAPFYTWFWRLPAPAAGRITRAVNKLERGLRPSVEPVGQGVFEAKIDFGPGYRIYFGLDGVTLIILLGGGNKQTQSDDILQAHERWSDYRRRKSRRDNHGAHT